MDLYMNQNLFQNEFIPVFSKNNQSVLSLIQQLHSHLRWIPPDHVAYSVIVRVGGMGDKMLLN